MLDAVGIDIVYLPRIKAAYQRFGQRFLDRIFTAAEQAYCLRSPAHCIARLGGRWAAKEAVVKALATGWQGYGYTDVEILANAQGVPTVQIVGHQSEQWRLSISHDGDYATAIAYHAAA